MRHKDIPTEAVEDPENEYWYYTYNEEDGRWDRWENNVNIGGHNSVYVVPDINPEKVPEQVKEQIKN